MLKELSHYRPVTGVTNDLYSNNEYINLMIPDSFDRLIKIEFNIGTQNLKIFGNRGRYDVGINWVFMILVSFKRLIIKNVRILDRYYFNAGLLGLDDHILKTDGQDVRIYFLM